MVSWRVLETCADVIQPCPVHCISKFLCVCSLQATVEVYSLVVLMRKMTKKQILFMIPLIAEWMIEEKKEGNK